MSAFAIIFEINFALHVNHGPGAKSRIYGNGIRLAGFPGRYNWNESFDNIENVIQ